MPSDPLAAFCHGLVKLYRTRRSQVRALQGITARFPAGALTAVAGPSGSGKSTLLRLLAGMDRPTGGSLVVDGVPVERVNSRALRRLRRRVVGYVFQRASDNFFPNLTVREHLELERHRSGGAPSLQDSEIAEILGIADRLDHRPPELSGGEQRRAAMAAVVAGGARIVVADEPTAELDTASSTEVIRMIRDLVARGVTVIVATHDQAVMRRADHLLELDHGELRAKSRPAQDASASYAPGSVRASHDEEISTAALAMGSVVRVSGVGKSYRRGTETVHAVRDAALELRAGELVGLIGRSGSGKTTLMNVIAGWERLDTGTVDVLGRNPMAETPSWDQVAVLPQRLGLIDELTIRENVEYPARLRGSLDETGERIDELIEGLGLATLQARYPKEVSVGEQQRAALARALVLSPRLLLPDEPTGHQDAGWAARVFQVMRSAVDDGTSCLAATHDEHILPYLDRVLTMSDGEVSEATG